MLLSVKVTITIESIKIRCAAISMHRFLIHRRFQFTLCVNPNVIDVSLPKKYVSNKSRTKQSASAHFLCESREFRC